MADLITTAQLKAYLRAGDEFDEASAALAVAGASGLVRDHCGWPISEVTGTLTVDGLGTVLLDLPTLYLTAVTEIRLNGVVVDPAEYVWAIRGQVRSYAGYWPVGLANVDVDCTHGHNPIPDGVTQISLTVAGSLYGNPQRLKSVAAGTVRRDYHLGDDGYNTAALWPYRLVNRP